MNNFAKWENRIRFGLLAFVSALMLWAFYGLITEAQAKPYEEYRLDYCEWCGEREDEDRSSTLNVHHWKLQSQYPELKDEPSNLFTFCRDCHFTVGHSGENWNYETPALPMLISIYGYKARHNLAGSGSTPPSDLDDPHQPLPAIHDVQPERK